MPHSELFAHLSVKIVDAQGRESLLTVLNDRQLLSSQPTCLGTFLIADQGFGQECSVELAFDEQYRWPPALIVSIANPAASDGAFLAHTVMRWIIYFKIIVLLLFFLIFMVVRCWKVK